MAKVITVTSGKGGVGKTNSIANIGIALAMKGHKVCLFDADTGLANVNILLGLKPEATLEQVISGEKQIDEIILDAQRGLKVVPGASGIAECADLEPEKRGRLIDSLQQLEKQFDYLLIDTAAGIGANVLDFVTSADYPIIIITPEPTSLTDAFSMVKVLKNRGNNKPLYALVNMARDYDNSIDVFNRFQAAVEKYLKTKVFYLGYIALDENVISSVSFQLPALVVQADAPASLCFLQLADVMEKLFNVPDSPEGFSAFWQKIAGSDVDSNKSALSEPALSPASPETLADSTLRLLNEPETSQESANSFIHPLLKSYFDRFQAYPLDIMQALYQQLEVTDFPESDIKELVNTLESLFEKHYKKPLRNLDSTVIKLLADASGSEEKLELLNQQLKNSFKRQFNRRLDNPLEEIIYWIKESPFTELDYKALQDEQKKAFLDHFGKPFEDEKDEQIRQLQKEVTELTAREEQLYLSFAELTSAMESSQQAAVKISDILGLKQTSEENPPPVADQTDSTGQR